MQWCSLLNVAVYVQSKLLSHLWAHVGAADAFINVTSNCSASRLARDRDQVFFVSYNTAQQHT